MKNASLLNLKADPITAVTPAGVKLESGTLYDLDVIVFVTGYNAITGSLLALNIQGTEMLLKDYWVNGPENYLGLAIPGFPNLFMITGPGSPSVLSNMPVSIEQHVDWVTDCIKYCERNSCISIKAQEQAASCWMDHVSATADATLLSSVKHSWYAGANIPGKPRVFMPYAGGLNAYRKICDSVAKDGYRGFDLS